MKKILLMIFSLFLFLTTISFAQDIDINKLSNSLRDKSFSVKTFKDTEYEPAYIYYDFNKKDGQFEILASVTVTEDGQLKKIFLKSSHIHLKPNLASVQSNFSKIENPFINAIEDTELKNIFKDAITNLPEKFKGEKFEASTFKTKNSIDINIDEKQPEFDWSKYATPSKSE